MDPPHGGEIRYKISHCFKEMIEEPTRNLTEALSYVKVNDLQEGTLLWPVGSFL